MNKKLLNKVMKKLASSNVVISPTVKSSSPSLSMQKKPEMEQIQQKLEQYLLSRYHFRFNVLTEQTECCKKDADTPIYKVISQRTLNSLCLEARARHINCWDKDVSRFVNSEQMPDYHPLLSYMNTLPEWDGMDRVTPLAQRISTKDFWVNSFHRWMLGVTAQWSGHMARCANAVAPMLVSSEQGRCKSTFCELLMPDSLKDYYTDSFELTGQAGCEQKLAFFGLINLDEYDRLSPQKLPLLKNLMQMKKLDFRKSHRSSYSHLGLETHNLTVDFGHDGVVLFVLHFRDEDFAFIELESANILDIQPSTKQDLHVLRHLKRVVTLENFHCSLLLNYALVVPHLDHHD